VKIKKKNTEFGNKNYFLICKRIIKSGDVSNMGPRMGKKKNEREIAK
jgi:hypothetical protein